MKKSNIYYNAVFKNNQLRDWARKAATNLLISLDDLKQENIDINTKSISEYDDFDQVNTIITVYLFFFEIINFIKPYITLNDYRTVQ